MNGPSAHKGSCERQNNKGMRRNKINNCAAARKFSITENNVRRWQQQKDELLNAHSTRMAF
jgi:hypothetical protein